MTGQIKLSSPSAKGQMSLEEAIARRRSVRRYADRPLSLSQISQILWSAQGVTDSARGLRAAPSAGACYPVIVYLLASRVEGLAPGLYRYGPEGHSLIAISRVDLREDLSKSCWGQSPVGRAPACVVLAADYQRIRPRYGQRSVRYTDMEVGHIGQNISLQAVALGLGTVMVGAFEDDGVKRVLGLPKDEAPLYIIPLGHPE